MPAACHAAQIQGRPSSNRYETAGGISFASVSGTADVEGITEFGDVSDPPRKYLEKHHGTGGWYREVTPTPRAFANGVDVRRLSTAGAVTSQLSYVEERNVGSGGANVPTLEDYVPTAAEFQSPFSPVWQREKRRKFFTAIAENPTEITPTFFGGTITVQDMAAGTFASVFVRNLAWVADHWEADVTFNRDHNFAVVTAVWQFALALAGGDNLPSSDATEWQLLIEQATNGGDQGVAFSTTLHLSFPPDCSARFWVRWYDPANTNAPVPEAEGAGQLDAGVNPWFYFPADPGDLPAPAYEERLGVENSIYDNLVVQGGAVGALREAVTNAYSGGTAPESEATLTFTGTVVKVSKIFRQLIAGHRYTWTINLLDVLIGGGPPILSSDSGSFDATLTDQLLEYELRAPDGYRRSVLSWTAVDDGPSPSVPAYNPETLFWWGRVLAAGGTMAVDSVAIADAFVTALKATSFATAVRYFLPLLGANLAAALIPLIDRRFWGSPSNFNFVDGDFSQATGLQGDGTTRRLSTTIKPSDLGATQNGGLFWWENAFIAGVNVEPIGCYNTAGTERFVLDLRTTWRAFSWGLNANLAGDLAPAGNGFFHGERTSETLRTLYADGSPVGSDTTNDAASGASDQPIDIMSSNESGLHFPWPGRCAAAGFTDGTLDNTEAASLFALVRDFLITPTGR